MNHPDHIPAGLSDARFDARYCRTHAFTARLYAAYPRRPSHADTWSVIAELWATLAAIKQRMDEVPPERQTDPRFSARPNTSAPAIDPDSERL